MQIAKDKEILIWQAENGLVMRIGSGFDARSYIAADKRALAGLIREAKFANEIDNTIRKER